MVSDPFVCCLCAGQGSACENGGVCIGHNQCNCSSAWSGAGCHVNVNECIETQLQLPTCSSESVCHVSHRDHASGLRCVHISRNDVEWAGRAWVVQLHVPAALHRRRCALLRGSERHDQALRTHLKRMGPARRYAANHRHSIRPHPSILLALSTISAAELKQARCVQSCWRTSRTRWGSQPPPSR